MINFIFSTRCPICYTEQNDENLCSSCFSKINFLSENFLLDISLFIESEYRVVSALIYDDFVKSLILRFKNNSDFHLKNLFIKFLINKFGSNIPKDAIIIPVPLHNKRLIKRGYNQSFILAKAFADLTNIQAIPDLLIKNKNTPSQGTKTLKERKKNVEGAFEFNLKYKNLIKNKSIIIIDDVITTGATILECAKIIRKYTDNEIILSSIARTLKV